MSDKSTLNELQPRKKKKKSVIGFVIAIVFLSLITLASLAVAYQSVKLYKDEVKKNEEAPVAEVTYTKEEVDEMVKLAREDAAEQATAGFYAELKDTAENSNGIVSMLRKMYPEYFVYYNNNHYEFVEIDHTIPQANFENENIIANEGFLEYKVDGETKSVKGIDVSKFQGDIDWQKVADSGVEYAMIRLGLRGYETGKLVTDENFKANVEGATAPFDICSAASKPETNFPEIGPTTNHFYCPSLKGRLGDESKVPEGVNYIPEVVINAIDEESMNKAVKAGIDAALNFEGVIGISAGNFDGKLGDKNINLLDILK